MEARHERFERFWHAYPRKVGKKQARRTFLKLQISEAELTRILTALDWQAKEWVDLRYAPHPSTYLNDERYTDEPLPLQKATPATVTSLPAWVVQQKTGTS
jgi:hypothetical protein